MHYPSRGPIRRLAPVIVLASGVALWWIVGFSEVSPLKLPRLHQVIEVFARETTVVLSYAAVTLLRVCAGLFLGGALGWLTGVAMSYNSAIRMILEPIIEMLRPIPPIVLIPFAILWFGLGTASQIAVIALGSFMVLVVSTIEAIGNIPPRYLISALSLGASRFRAFLFVLVPATLPHLLGPIRVASGTAFGLTVAAEYLGAEGGLGYMIRNARVTLSTDALALASILIGIEAVAFDGVLCWVWGRRTRWHDRLIEENVEGTPTPSREVNS